MIELAAPAQAQAEADIAIDLAAAERRLWEIIQAPVKLDETVMPKNIIDAIKTLAAVRGWNAPTNINVNKHVHTDWSTDELVAFITDAEQALSEMEARLRASQSLIRFTEYTNARYHTARSIRRSPNSWSASSAARSIG